LENAGCVSFGVASMRTAATRRTGQFDGKRALEALDLRAGRDSTRRARGCILES